MRFINTTNMLGAMRTRLLAAPIAAIALLLLAGCATNASPAAAPPAAPATTETASGCAYPEQPGGVREVASPPETPAVSGTVAAVMQTSAGDLNLSLDADAAPCTVNSFVSLATQQFYDNTTCHRLTTSGIFVLQCGDPSATGRGGPGYSYADELGGTETYPAGTIAMANAGPNTNGSQFFLVYEDTQLSPAYTVFGTMDEASTKIVQDIAAKGSAGGGADGAPAEPVTITAVTIG